MNFFLGRESKKKFCWMVKFLNIIDVLFTPLWLMLFFRPSLLTITILQTLLIYVTAAAVAAPAATYPIFQYGIVLNKDVNSLFSVIKIRYTKCVHRLNTMCKESVRETYRQTESERESQQLCTNTNKCKFLVRCIVQISAALDYQHIIALKHTRTHNVYTNTYNSLALALKCEAKKTPFCFHSTGQIFTFRLGCLYE